MSPLTSYRPIAIGSPYVHVTPTGRLSKHVLDPFPAPPSKRGASSKKNGQAAQKQEDKRFTPRIRDAVFSALTESFINMNRFRPEGWALSPVRSNLNLIHDQILAIPTTGGINFGSLLNQKNMGLAVVTIKSLTSLIVDVVPNIESVFTSFGIIPCIQLSVIHQSARTDIPASGLLLPLRRLEIAEGMFTVPNGSAVVGPYLAILPYEKSTGMIVRASIWPIWISPDMNHPVFQIVGSGLERLFYNGIHEVGAVAFSRCDPASAKALQQGLGHRWTGDITAYRYLADGFIFPASYQPVTVAELYGIRGSVRYDAGKNVKEEHGQQLFLDGLIMFASLDATKLHRNKIEAETYKLFVQDRAIWKRPKADINLAHRQPKGIKLRWRSQHSTPIAA